MKENLEAFSQSQQQDHDRRRNVAKLLHGIVAIAKWLFGAITVLLALYGGYDLYNQVFPGDLSMRIDSVTVTTNQSQLDVSVSVEFTNGEVEERSYTTNEVNGRYFTNPIEDINNHVGPDAIGDLDGDGFDEVVIGTSTLGKDHSQVICYEAPHFDKPKWSFPMGARNPYGNSQGNVEVQSIHVVDVDGDPKTKEVVASAVVPGRYGTHIVILTHDRRLIGQYWHPGNVTFRQIVPVEDGGHQLLFTGDNNDFAWLRQTLNVHSVVFLLEPDGVGQLPPYLGRQPGSLRQRAEPVMYANLKWSDGEKIDIHKAEYKPGIYDPTRRPNRVPGIRMSIGGTPGGFLRQEMTISIDGTRVISGFTEVYEQYLGEEVDIGWMAEQLSRLRD